MTIAFFLNKIELVWNFWPFVYIRIRILNIGYLQLLNRLIWLLELCCRWTVFNSLVYFSYSLNNFAIFGQIWVTTGEKTWKIEKRTGKMGKNRKNEEIQGISEAETRKKQRKYCKYWPVGKTGNGFSFWRNFFLPCFPVFSSECSPWGNSALFHARLW